MPKPADERGALVVDRPVKTFLICSGTPGEGKSTVARSLGLVYAEAGLSAALVEADVRRPTVSASLDMDSSVGLTEVIAGHVAARCHDRVEYAGGHAALARTGVADGEAAPRTLRTEGAFTSYQAAASHRIPR